MVIEEIKFINDVIQDTRVDTRIETKYEILINYLFKNSKLNWNKEGLTLNSDEKVFNLIEALEPERYQNAFTVLNVRERNTEKE